MENQNKIHKHLHNFIEYLSLKFGADLREEKILQFNSKKYIDINEHLLMERLYGIEVIRAIEKYVEEVDNSIKISYCDDDSFASSIIVLIPHETMGVSMIFVPKIKCFFIQII